MRQLPLGVQLHDRAVFASFHPGSNLRALAAAQATAGAAADSSDTAFTLLYLHGIAGSGKSHLLQAMCAAVPGAAYVPLPQLRARGPAVLGELGTAPLVAIDDAESICGDAPWETALFSLYETLQSAGRRLAVAAAVPASDLPVALPDLRSRLAAMPHFALQPLDERQQRDALRVRAAARGIILQEDALDYLQRRFARDMGSQYALLERLDAASLEAQRPLTVPFIRRVLGEST